MKYSQPSYYHFSSPSIELVHFALENYLFSEDDRIIDVFSGCGVIGLELFEKQQKNLTIDFCEIQAESVEHLKINISNSKLSSYQIYESSYEDLFGTYSVILANPPFFEKNEARLSEDQEKNICRHFLFGDIQDFLKKAHSLLEEEGVLFILQSSTDDKRFQESFYDSRFKIEKEKREKNYHLMKLVKCSTRSCFE